MLCTQNPAKPTDPAKLNVLMVLNDPRSRSLQSRVDKYIEESKKTKVLKEKDKLQI